MCHHRPPCPGPQASDRLAAHVIAARPEQGWSLLCNGIVLFDDNGVLLPDGQALAPEPVPAGSARVGRGHGTDRIRRAS